jgi:hypothetical protein
MFRPVTGSQSATSSAGLAYGRWKGRMRSPKAVVSSPCEPSPQNRDLASSGGVPSATIISTSRSEMPTPAVPAPCTTIRWSLSLWPSDPTPDRIAAATTAAVPWTSSLKEHVVARYVSRMRWALAAPKSSQWIIAYGKVFDTPSTNAAMNSS